EQVASPFRPSHRDFGVNSPRRGRGAREQPLWERAAILDSPHPTSNSRRTALFVVLVLIVGLASGAAGALIGVRVARPEAKAVSTPAATDQPSRVRAVVDRDLGSVVTVVADLPPTPAAGGVNQTTNLGSGVVVADSGFIV